MRIWLFLVSLAVNCPNFAATVTAFSCPLYLCRIKRKNSFCACGLSLSSAQSLTLLPFVISSPDLGAWPNIWVSMKFLCTPILQKSLGSTTTKRPFTFFWSSYLGKFMKYLGILLPNVLDCWLSKVTNVVV